MKKYCSLNSIGYSLEKQAKTFEKHSEKQFEDLKSFESSNKEMPSLKNLISEKNLNHEILNEIENIKEQK